MYKVSKSELADIIIVPVLRHCLVEISIVSYPNWPMKEARKQIYFGENEESSFLLFAPRGKPINTRQLHSVEMKRNDFLLHFLHCRSYFHYTERLLSKSHFDLSKSMNCTFLHVK